MTRFTGHANPHIRKVTVLQRKPSKGSALSLLKEVAKRTSYLMKENGFHIGTLVEFCPRDQQLLGMNVNQGAKILLRLRNPHDECKFLPMDSILSTMIHELTHNLHGPHDDSFYAKLDSLKARQWVIERRGLFDTFLGQGRRLGGPIIQRRSSRGRRLGGSRPDLRGSPKEMAALAAQRRIQDSMSCGDANKYEYEEDVVVIDERQDNRTEPNLGSKSNIEVIDLT